MDAVIGHLRLFLRIALRIRTAHEFRVISVLSRALAYTQRIQKKRLRLREKNHRFFSETSTQTQRFFFI